jgi:hypothetical protein
MTHIVSSWTILPYRKPLHDHHSGGKRHLTKPLSLSFSNTASSSSSSSPPLFSDSLYTDIQNCLLTLERRVKEGSGSLNHDDVDSFAMASARILKDMKAADASLLQKDRLKPGERHVRAEAAASAAAIQAEKEGKTFEEIKVLAKKAYDEAFAMTVMTTTATTATTTTTPKPPSDPIIDSSGRMTRTITDDTSLASTSTSTTTTTMSSSSSVLLPSTTIKNRIPSPDQESEGPVYDGSGFGVARGTANTYFIEGMDEMTADEYQEALAQQVIERARRRRYGLGGAHGNRQTLDYMNSLSGGRDINPMNAPPKE